MPATRPHPRHPHPLSSRLTKPHPLSRLLIKPRLLSLLPTKPHPLSSCLLPTKPRPLSLLPPTKPHLLSSLHRIRCHSLGPPIRGRLPLSRPLSRWAQSTSPNPLSKQASITRSRQACSQVACRAWSRWEEGCSSCPCPATRPPLPSLVSHRPLGSCHLKPALETTLQQQASTKSHRLLPPLPLPRFHRLATRCTNPSSRSSRRLAPMFQMEPIQECH